MVVLLVIVELMLIIRLKNFPGGFQNLRIFPVGIFGCRVFFFLGEGVGGGWILNIVPFSDFLSGGTDCRIYFLLIFYPKFF